MEEKGNDIEEKEQEFTPYIHHSEKIKELSFTSIITGILTAVVFGAANAYLGLRVGLTVTASIPAAVIAIGVMKAMKRKNSILESNIIETVGATGEAIAAGAVFTMPAFFMWAEAFKTPEISVLEMFLIALSGGVLGILFSIPLRKTLTVKEHKTLPFPEGLACCKVLLAGEKEGGGSLKVFAGIGIAAIIRFAESGINLISETISLKITQLQTEFKIDVEPSLISVGYICGFRISSYLFAGGILGWLALIPAVVYLGVEAVIYPGTVPIAEMYREGGPDAIWSNYIRYIGAGTVAMGAFISLAKNLPMIIRTFVKSVQNLKDTEEGEKIRTNTDLARPFILLGILAALIVIVFAPSIPVGIAGAFIILVFGFFFSVVSSRMTGIVGSSNNPISGTVIATLLITALILKASGSAGFSAMFGAMAIGTIVAVMTTIAGGFTQDLKTGFLLGTTPKAQEIGALIGVVAASAAIGGILFLLNDAWGFGSPSIPAPQATLMKMVVEGVINGNLPWALVIIGALIAVTVEILGIPSLPFSIGLYLPLNFTTAIMLGGLLRLWHEKRKRPSEEAREAGISSGILCCSGMIAGGGLTGILLAVLAVIPLGAQTLGTYLGTSGSAFSIGSAGSIIAAIVMFVFISVMSRKREIKDEK